MRKPGGKDVNLTSAKPSLVLCADDGQPRAPARSRREWHRQGGSRNAQLKEGAKDAEMMKL
ncbi:MAG TPA: hypothetical protein VMT15_17635 [Bryobacteraceae bacterium]|nr:hypothetical protein [Bryobacteraceae bacterium]